MKKLLMFLIATVFVVLQTQAQTAGQYGFSTATNSSLIDMSSGTTNIFATGTYRDDDASALQTIGFTFRFCGTDYTQYSINSNGQMRLGSTVIAGGSTSAGSNTPMIIPLSGDNSLQAAGKAHFKVLGSAPDRILVIEWDKVRVNYSSSDVTGPFCTFQVLLYETTNVINFIYGTMYNRSTSSQSRSIGISNSNSTGTVGYVATITTTPTFTSASSYGTTSFISSSNMINLNSSTQGSRRIFAFTPPNPCVTPTTQPTNLVFSNITSTTLTGTYTAAAGNDSYLVVRSTTNTHDTPPVDGTVYTAGSTLGNGTITYSGSALTFNATGLSSSTQYYYFVYSMNSACSGGPKYLTSAPLSLNITTGPADPIAPLSLTVTSATSIAIGVTPNANGDDLLIAWNTVNTFGNPTGTYAVGDAIIGGGTVFFSNNLAIEEIPEHTGLTSGTTYYYKAWSKLGTLYSGSISANATTFFLIPYSQNFNSALTLPTGWAGSPTFSVSASHGNNSSNGIYYNLYSSYPTVNISSPGIQLSANPCRLKYDYRIINYTGYPATATALSATDKVEIQLSLDNGTSYNTIYTINQSTHITSNNFATNIIDLTSYSGSAAKIKILGTWGTGDYYLDIDNFAIEEIPSCFEPTALNASSVTSNSATINWTASTSNPTGGYEYEVRTSGGAGSGATGLVTSGTTAAGVVTANISSLTANTTYSFYVRSYCGSGNYSSWPIATFFTGYCTPAPSSVDGSGITNVSFSSVNNTTGTETGNYGNYSTMIGDVQQATTVAVSITFSTGYDYDTKIWIDWNDDLDFADAGEEVYSGTSLSTNPTTLAASFIVPLTATLGNHRMRIGSQDSGPAVPCYTGTWGSYEDYTINVLVAPSCFAPSLLAATNITAHQADLAWTENGTATSWDIEWGATPFTPTGTPTISGVTNPYTLTGLSQTTGYAYYVRANCGSSYSIWSGPKTFTTPVSCPAPTALTATNITTTSADLGWTNPGGSTWNIEWGVTGFTPTGTPTITGITTNPYTLNGLSASSTYQFYIQSDCGIDGSSLWAGPFSFTTKCNSFSLPFNEDFNTSVGCWSQQNIGTGITDRWSITNSSNAGGTANEATCTFQNLSPATTRLVTPELNTSGLSTIKLAFKHLFNDYGPGATLKIQSSSDGINWTDESWSLASTANVNIGPATVSLLINNNLGATTYIAFVVTGNLYQIDYWHIDNVSITVPQAGLWTGNTSNDWTTATNWDNFIVPTGTPSITIPATATFFPTLTAPVTINKLTIESNASGTGSLLDNGYLTMTGTATVKQYVQGEKWHLISSPVQNATAGVFHLASGQANIYIREFVGGAWNYITNVTTPIVTNKGYGIWADTQTNSTPHPTVPFVGSLNTGVQLLPTTGGSAWDLLGNPYVSAINWNTVNTANVAGGAVRVWNQALTLYSAYSSLGGSVNGGNQYLAPMQGFFVQTTDANGISLDNTNRVHNGQLFLKSTNSISDLVKITAQRGSYKDEINVVMNPIATNNYDVQYDASKLFANDNNIPEIYTTSGNHNLVINIFKNAPIAIPMNIRLGVSDNVTLTASEYANFDANVSIKLEDLLLGTTQDLRLNPSYTFIASVGDNANRFVLHFATATGINENNGGNTSIYAYDNTIYVNTTEQVKEINIYNMLGQVITSVAGNGKSLNTIKVDKATAYYVVKVTTDKGVRTEKVFVK